MANYKVVDSQKLDADLTLVADAIRKRSGSSGKLEFPQAMADTVLAIPAEGMKLPELETPAAASDLAYNKQLIGPDGNIVTGTLYELTDSSVLFSDRTHEIGGTKGDTAFNVSGVYPGASVDGVIVRPNARLGVRKIPTSLLGNAAADQVAKGATFTSAAGFLMEGTHECEGSLELPELGDTAAKPTDMAADKSLYDDQGNLVTGTLIEANEIQEKLFATSDYSFGGTPGGTVFHVSGMYNGNLDGVIVRPGAGLGVRNAPTEFFGNAEASDVAKGKTFTSSAGLLVEGTLETGGVHMSVDGETLVITGAVTIENETLLL